MSASDSLREAEEAADSAGLNKNERAPLASHVNVSRSAANDSSLPTHNASDRSRGFFTPISAPYFPSSPCTSAARSSSSRSQREHTAARNTNEGQRGRASDTHHRHHSSSPAPDKDRSRGMRVVEDPQTTILNHIMRSRTGRVTVSELSTVLEWGMCYEDLYGDLLAFLQSYQSLFRVSPVDDTVTLQTEAILRYDHRRLPARRTGATGGGTRPRRRQERGHHTAAGGGAELLRQQDTPKLHAASDEGFDASTEGCDTSFSKKVGSISYSSVAEGFDLGVLSTYYKRRGYAVCLEHDVLHVSHRVANSSFLPAAEVMADASFDMYLFPTGGVVWWGIHRSAHQIVERHFLSPPSPLVGGVYGRYPDPVIEELFPSWCTFEVEMSPTELTSTVAPKREEEAEEEEEAALRRAPGQRGPTSPLRAEAAPPADEDVDAALVRFSRRLCYDHYILPGHPIYRAQIMLAVSHCLAWCARMDYLEHVTQATHHHVLAIPGDFKNLLDYFSTKKKVDQLSGELLVAQLAVRTLKDSPEFLWEMPWLQPFCDLTDAQYASEHRLSWFSARSRALLEQLANVKRRRFRLFMLGSDVFLIVLLILDVFFMTSRLVVKLYFRLPEEEPQ